MDKKNEKHIKGWAKYIKDMVYGANDGIITTFAVIAGAAGAGLSSAVIVILGFSNLLADGFSMAASNYLGSRSEKSLFQKERGKESEEVNAEPEEEKSEINEIFIKKGYTPVEAEQLTGLVSKNKDFWVDFMMKYELEMGLVSKDGKEFSAAAVTFTAFVLAGTLPLLPFIVFPSAFGNILLFSVIATAISLFSVGSARCLITGKNWLLSGFEMLLIGGIASTVAYLVGYLISTLVL